MSAITISDGVCFTYLGMFTEEFYAASRQGAAEDTEVEQMHLFHVPEHSRCRGRGEEDAVWKPGTQMTFRRLSLQVWCFMGLWGSSSYSLLSLSCFEWLCPRPGEFRPRLRQWLVVNPLLLEFDGVGLPEVLLESFMLHVACVVTNDCISSSFHTHFHPVHLSSVQLTPW